MNALQRQFEQVKQHASPEGTKALMSKLDAVKTAYADVAESAAERQAVLLNAVKHRQQFYGQFQDFEKWLKKSQRKLDSGNEIYADEVPEMQLKLKARGEENLSLFMFLITFTGMFQNSVIIIYDVDNELQYMYGYI